jgi:hypothetical protein
MAESFEKLEATYGPAAPFGLLGPPTKCTTLSSNTG